MEQQLIKHRLDTRRDLFRRRSIVTYEDTAILDKPIIITEELLDLKAILLHSKKHKNERVIVKVSTSRFLSIAKAYYAMCAINIEGKFENYAGKYSNYKLSGLDSNNNVYKVVRIKSSEIQGKCLDCNCKMKKRWINPVTSVCYYKEMINKDYTTKI